MQNNAQSQVVIQLLSAYFWKRNQRKS